MPILTADDILWEPPSYPRKRCTCKTYVSVSFYLVAGYIPLDVQMDVGIIPSNKDIYLLYVYQMTSLPVPSSPQKNQSSKIHWSWNPPLGMRKLYHPIFIYIPKAYAS